MKYNRFDNQQAFELLAQRDFQRLFYGALKSAHVTKAHPQFEDCVVQAQLAWLAAYTNFPGSLETELHDFEGFAFQRIKWRVTDYLKKWTKDRQRQQPTDDLNVLEQQQFQAAANAFAASTSQLLADELYKAVLKICSTREQQYLHASYQQQATISEIADELGISRQAVHQIRQRIAKKSLSLLSELRDPEQW